MDAEIPGLASYRELHSLVAEIEALIDPYDPLDVIASFSFENLAYTTDNTLLGDGGQAFVEYVASLCLKKTGSSGKSRSIPPVVIAELQEKIERLFSSVALRRGLRNRTDFYGPALVQNGLDVWNAKSNWSAILAQYDVNAALLPVDSALATVLRERPDWTAIYQDRVAVLFERTDKSK